MILNRVNLEELKPKVHAALDKKLEKMTKFGKSLSVTINLEDLFNIEHKPIIFITKQAQTKMTALVKLSSKEIAWHGTVTKEETDSGDVYTVHDILVYPQEVTGATTQATDDVGMWYMKLPDEVFPLVRMQGHSHVHMGTNPSAVDERYYDSLIATVKDYYIFMVLNKHGSLHIELRDVANGITFEKKDLIVDYEEKTNPIEEWATKQIAEHIQKLNRANIQNNKRETAYERSERLSRTSWNKLSKEEKAEIMGCTVKEYDEYYSTLTGGNY